MKRYILIIFAAWLLAIMPFIIFGQDAGTLTDSAPTAADKLPAPEEIPYLTYLLKWNQAVLGLPALPLVLVGCVMVGYFVKLLPIVKNRWIPTWVFVFGIGVNLVITPPKSAEILGRAVIYGLICAGASIFVHRRWLKNWIDIDVFKDIGKEEQK